jgi:hypothetical protein
MKAPLEKDVQATCLDWLRVLGAFPVRINSGALKVGTRLVRFNREPGCSDALCVLPGGRFLAVEFKRAGRDRTSAKRKAEQQSFRQQVVRAGGLAVVVRSLDELKADLAAEGYDTEVRRG